MTSCGIDFGTSNSAACFSNENKIQMVRLEGSKTNIPSAVFFNTEEDRVLFGQAGINAFTEGFEGRLMRSLKSILGTSLIHERTQIGNKRMSFEDILIGFIKHLKNKTEGQSGYEIESVVMGRPVHFVDGNNDGDQAAEGKLAEIAKNAGFKHVKFQFEPIAAALSYESTLKKDELALIADIGGGTSDFSVIKVGPSFRGNVERSTDILANTGVRVGGTNLDTRLSVNSIMPHFGMNSKLEEKFTGGYSSLPAYLFYDLATWHKIHMLYTNKNELSLNELALNVSDEGEFERYIQVVKMQQGHTLAGLVERAKIELSDNMKTSLALSEILPADHTKVTLNRPDFETAILEEQEKIRRSIKECINHAGIKESNITALFLTGGSTGVPVIKKVICEAFPEANIVSGDMFNSVGQGLGIEAGRVFA